MYATSQKPPPFSFFPYTHTWVKISIKGEIWLCVRVCGRTRARSIFIVRFSFSGGGGRRESANSGRLLAASGTHPALRSQNIFR